MSSIIGKLVRKKILAPMGLEVVKIDAKDSLDYLIKEYGIKTLVDVGANDGAFASSLRKNNEHLYIHCFEPILSVYTELEKKFANDKNSKIYNIALGEKEGKAEMVVNANYSSSSFLRLTTNHLNNYPSAQEKEKETVTVKRLENALNHKSLTKNILTKIDVQGFEDKVIGGGTPIIRSSKIVMIEVSFVELYKDQKLFWDIHGRLSGMGLKFWRLMNEEYDKTDGKLLFADAIYINDKD